jgi:hypothetical protein
VFVSPHISDSGGVAACVVVVGKIRDSSLRACGASLGMTCFLMAAADCCRRIAGGKGLSAAGLFVKVDG